MRIRSYLGIISAKNTEKSVKKSVVFRRPINHSTQHRVRMPQLKQTQFKAGEGG